MQSQGQVLCASSYGGLPAPTSMKEFESLAKRILARRDVSIPADPFPTSSPVENRFRASGRSGLQFFPLGIGTTSFASRLGVKHHSKFSPEEASWGQLAGEVCVNKKKFNVTQDNNKAKTKVKRFITNSVSRGYRVGRPWDIFIGLGQASVVDRAEQIPVEFKPSTPNNKLAEVVEEGGVRKIIFSWRITRIPELLANLVFAEEVLHYIHDDDEFVHPMIDEYIKDRYQREIATALNEAKEMVEPLDSWAEMFADAKAGEGEDSEASIETPLPGGRGVLPESRESDKIGPETTLSRETIQRIASLIVKAIIRVSKDVKAVEASANVFLNTIRYSHGVAFSAPNIASIFLAIQQQNPEVAGQILTSFSYVRGEEEKIFKEVRRLLSGPPAEPRLTLAPAVLSSAAPSLPSPAPVAVPASVAPPALAPPVPQDDAQAVRQEEEQPSPVHDQPVPAKTKAVSKGRLPGAEAIGIALRAARDRKEFVQEGLAKAVGTYQMKISRIEAGEIRDKDKPLMNRIAAALGVSVRKLKALAGESRGKKEEPRARKYWLNNGRVIGRRIKELREGRGISQDALAKNVGTHQKKISQIEEGWISSRDISLLQKIADQFKVSGRSLLRGS